MGKAPAARRSKQVRGIEAHGPAIGRFIRRKAAAGGFRRWRWPRIGIRRRFHLAVVDARLRSRTQTVLAASRFMAGKERRLQRAKRVGQNAAAALSASEPNRFFGLCPHYRRSGDRRSIVHSHAGFARRIETTNPSNTANRRLTGILRDVIEPGDYSIAVTATKNGGAIGEAKARFVIFEQDLEMENAAARPELMASLAKMTAANGGEVVAPEQLPALSNASKNSPAIAKWQLKPNTRLGPTVFFLDCRRTVVRRVVFCERWGWV